jgi:hypothetical protein
MFRAINYCQISAMMTASSGPVVHTALMHDDDVTDEEKRRLLRTPEFLKRYKRVLVGSGLGYSYNIITPFSQRFDSLLSHTHRPRPRPRTLTLETACSNMQRLADQQVLNRRRKGQPAPTMSMESFDKNISLNNSKQNGHSKAPAPNGCFPWGMWNIRPEEEEEKGKEVLRETEPSAQFEMIATSVSETASDVLCVLAANNVLEDDGSASDSSLSADGIRKEGDALPDATVPEKRASFAVRFIRHRRKADVREIDLEKYMTAREMTATQEKWNAVTMIPNPLYCLYFLLSGNWVSPNLVHEARQAMVMAPSVQSAVSMSTGFRVFRGWRRLRGFGGLANVVVGDIHGCLKPESSWFPHNMPALPPLPVMAVALGIILHAPFSFWYHWKTPQLPRGSARTTHWTRRMDQSMIHVASALLSYATSGSWDYFFANCLYNGDCIYRQFKTKVRPRRNQIRIGISFLAYILPVLKRGDFYLGGQLFMVMLTSGWLFTSYPIGGWSHCVFHFVIAILPPLLMNAACELPSAQDQMKLAAQCFVAGEQAFNSSSVKLLKNA